MGLREVQSLTSITQFMCNQARVWICARLSCFLYFPLKSCYKIVSEPLMFFPFDEVLLSPVRFLFTHIWPTGNLV